MRSIKQPFAFLKRKTKMSFLDTLESVVKGVALGIATVTALPVFGAAGTITAMGVAVGSTVGAVAAVADELTSDG